MELGLKLTEKRHTDVENVNDIRVGVHKGIHITYGFNNLLLKSNNQ